MHAARAIWAAIVVAIAFNQGCTCSKPPPVPLEGEEAKGPLVFPPPDDGWKDRLPIKENPSQKGATTTGGHAQKHFDVQSPSLDQNGKFEQIGPVVEITFDDDAVLALDKAPALEISPKVAAKTVWTSARSVELRADKPFDHTVDYTITIPELTNPSGKTMPGWKGTFRAKPETVIAGKTVHWIPKPGVPRVVYVRPIYDKEVGPDQESMVLFDQPIDDATARALITVTTDQGTKVPLSITHPPAGNTFEGQKVDTKSIVFVKMTPAPAPKTKVTLSANSKLDTDQTVTRTLTIADPPKFKSMSCSDCEVKGTTMTGHVASMPMFEFTNYIKHDKLETKVTVTPKPPNLTIGGWGDYVSIDASWAAATTYQIQATGLVDRYGYPVPAVSATFVVRPRAASAILREGVLVLDQQGAKEFFVTTRNVKKGELHVWPVAKGGNALAEALTLSSNNETPKGEAKIIPFDGAPDAHTFVRSGIDLGSKLEAGNIYLAQVGIKETSHNAQPSKYTNGSDASKPSVPLILIASKEAIAAHAHAVAGRALVHVYRLASGEPVPNAEVSSKKGKGTTDANGNALVDFDAGTYGEIGSLTVRAGNEETALPFVSKITTSASSVYPKLAENEWEAPKTDHLGFLITDKGIYRPGGTLQVKGLVRKPEPKRVAPASKLKVRLKVQDPGGSDIVDEALETSATGAIDKEIAIAQSSRTGKWRILLTLDDKDKTILAEDSVRVAEFETPRFKVDVDVPDAPEGRFKARVAGKYFFGAPMKDGTLNWTLKKKLHTVAAGALGEAGLSFSKSHNEFEGPDESESIRPLTGEGKLKADGTFDIDVALGPMPDGPASLTLEADVTDSSYRHIVGKKTVVRSTAQRFAGVRSPGFGGIQTIKVDLGVVDRKGAPVVGVPVEARLERIEWKKTSTKAESGAVIETWGTSVAVEGSCTATSAATPASCELPVKHGGDHRVVSRVDGHDGGSQWYYAWWGEHGGGENYAVPTSGKKVPASSDKKTYKSGETAKVLVQSPFPEATAILTVQRGGIAKHESKRVKGPSVTFDVPLNVADAPHVFAVVTLLPINVPDASWRVGAVKLGVSLDEAKLAVKIVSDKKAYEPKTSADVTVEVTRGGQPIKNADVTLAVVDEAILRVTDFHQKDPLMALHPARGLSFMAADTRQLLFRKLEKEKAHAAGGGDADDRESVDTRKDFVETLAWLPRLSTDDKGRAKTTLKLLDNLTEFRMMATVIDGEGSAGTGESSFIVTRPFLLDPILPAFAIKGDKLEVGAMAHNNTDAAVNAKVKIFDQTRDIRIEPHGHTRVTIPWDATKSTAMKASIDVDGKTRDVVEKPIKVNLRGTEEHPTLTGVFRGTQEITLQIPEDIVFEDGAKLTIRTGAALYPELGHRLTFLLDYPHGCVEQTTSGLLPLLAAKELLAWTGTDGLEDEELKKRIVAGVKRLASMKTASGGLAFWPGGSEPHINGTAYALRALLRAKERGIEEEGLIDDVVKYLKQNLGTGSDPLQVMENAESLAQAKELDAAAADPLWDKRHKLDPFHKATLALALGALPKQEDRVKTLLDELEGMFDERGNVKEPEDKESPTYRFHYWWYSADRHRAQALLALMKLRPQSKLTPVLAQRMIKSVERYTTSSVAWTLMALGAYIGKQDPRGGVDVKVKNEGVILDRTRKLGGDNKEVAIPLAELKGKKTVLRLEGSPETPCAFALEARYARPDDKSARHAKRSPMGPSIYRVYTDSIGNPIELAKVKPGDVVRVALRVEVAELDEWRMGYLAVSDRFAAGFDPVQPDLATVASVPEVTGAHPFYSGLRGWGGSASYVDVRSDRVNVYFDRPYGKVAYASYLLRAVTPGEFFLPPARGELMYEPNSEGYSDGGRVTIR